MSLSARELFPLELAHFHDPLRELSQVAFPVARLPTFLGYAVVRIVAVLGCDGQWLFYRQLRFHRVTHKGRTVRSLDVGLVLAARFSRAQLRIPAGRRSESRPAGSFTSPEEHFSQVVFETVLVDVCEITGTAALLLSDMSRIADSRRDRDA